MSKHALLKHLLLLLATSSCGQAFESKPEVVNKRSGSAAGGSDAVAWRDGLNRTGDVRQGSSAPGSVASGSSGNPNPSDPNNPAGGGGTWGDPGSTGGTGNEDHRGGETPPPVQTSAGEALTLDNACYKGDQFLCQIEIALANKTNAYRAALGPLNYSSSMAWVARDWSQQQAAANSLGHGGFPAARYTKFSGEFGANTPVNFSAENVAYAYGSSAMADEIANELIGLWIASSGHRENIVGDYKTVGIGVSKTGNYYYATQLFGK